MKSIIKIKILLILTLSYFVCVPLTEKENCAQWGCPDTEFQGFEILACPGYIELSSFDCKNLNTGFWAKGRYKTEEECLGKINSDKDGFLMGCLIGLRDTNNLNKKSDIPWSGGWCLFNC